MAQIYLRDLSESLQKDYLYFIKREAKNGNSKAIQLLEAYNNGEDIAVGVFYKGDCVHSCEVV